MNNSNHKKINTRSLSGYSIQHAINQHIKLYPSLNSGELNTLVNPNESPPKSSTLQELPNQSKVAFPELQRIDNFYQVLTSNLQKFIQQNNLHYPLSNLSKNLNHFCNSYSLFLKQAFLVLGDPSQNKSRLSTNRSSGIYQTGLNLSQTWTQLFKEYEKVVKPNILPYKYSIFTSIDNISQILNKIYQSTSNTRNVPPASRKYILSTSKFMTMLHEQMRQKFSSRTRIPGQYESPTLLNDQKNQHGILADNFLPLLKNQAEISETKEWIKKVLSIPQDISVILDRDVSVGTFQGLTVSKMKLSLTQECSSLSNDLKAVFSFDDDNSSIKSSILSFNTDLILLYDFLHLPFSESIKSQTINEVQNEVLVA